jgi:hypothetical protein
MDRETQRYVMNSTKIVQTKCTGNNIYYKFKFSKTGS